MPSIGPAPVRDRDWIIQAYYRAVSRAREDRLDPGWHHPSAMFSPCVRQLQWRFIGMPVDNPVGPKVQMAGEMGTALHKLAEGVKKEEHVFGTELSLEEPSIPIRGHTDAAVLDYDDTPAIVDWKSCNQFPGKIADSYRLQASWYAYMAQVPRIIVVYIQRGSGDMRRYELDWDQLHEFWELSREQAALVTAMTKREELAPRTPRSRAQDCNGCPFLNTCERTELGLDEGWRFLAHRVAEDLEKRGWSA